MKMSEAVECPVDFVTVNDNKVRVVAAFVFVLAAGYWFLAYLVVPLFLTLDFFMRAFNGGKWSLLQWLANLVEKHFSLPQKPTDRGPKRFAASVGFYISLLILLSAVFHYTTLSFYFAGLIVLFSFLEFALGFCAGCYVYTIIRRISNRRA